MKTKKIIKISTSLFLLAVSVMMVQAQEKLSLSSSSSSIVIKGSSNLHDWEMNVTRIKGYVIVDTMGGNKVKEAILNVRSESILSDNSIMDGKAHDALMAEEYPNISFRMVRVYNVKNMRNKVTGKVEGYLTIAGTTKAVKFSYTGYNTSANSFKVKGEFSINMSSFEIEPPTAMLGSLRTYDNVSIHFNLEFK